MISLFRLLGAVVLALAFLLIGRTFAVFDSPGMLDNTLVARNSLAVVLLFATPAFVLFVLQRRDAGLPAGWRDLWTAAWLAFLAYRWWEGWDALVEGGKIPPPNGWPYGADLVLALWWGLDIVLAWTAGLRVQALKLPRGLLHTVAFVALLWVAVFRNQGVVRGFGVAMLVAALFAAVARIALRRFDPNTLTGKLFVGGFRMVNAFVRWDRLPTWLAVVNLGALREDLRAKNLHDTSTVPVTNPAGVATVPPFDPKYLSEREPDGHFNDLDKPTMGRASANPANPVDSMHYTLSHPSARFGRNVPLAEAHPDRDRFQEPNPRTISNELLARRAFLPAESLNLLAAAWIQFETHDWFNHGEPVEGGEHRVDVPEGDWHERPMQVRRTRPDPTRDYPAEGQTGFPPTFTNSESHWWDGSQIYGSDTATTQRLRTGPDGAVLPDGKLAIDGERLARDPRDLDTALSGFTGNWWAGLSLLHTLFTREHNAICDQLRREYLEWSSDQIFAVARMANAALMAKIHTVEWTPAILGHPALQIAMNANWWGLMSERLTRLFGHLSENEAFGGLPNSGVDHHGADYCLTEEFVSVYRMHPLMPDELKVLSIGTGRELRTFKFPDSVLGPEGTLQVFGEDRTVADVFYSFGRAHPGAITLHNYPNYLRKLRRPDGEIIDLATIDVLRDRERGVPRYNRFRQLLRLKPIASFDDFKNPLHPDLGNELRKVYGRDNSGHDRVDLLDTMVGMFAEVPPAGFGFSDTAFRIFILMASRRLKSDRFIAQDFTPEVYTPIGHAWVNDNTMSSVLLRHFPELRPALRGVTNAFKPWTDPFAPRGLL